MGQILDFAEDGEYFIFPADLIPNVASHSKVAYQISEVGLNITFPIGDKSRHHQYSDSSCHMANPQCMKLAVVWKYPCYV
jgi:hypothetical protein